MRRTSIQESHLKLPPGSVTAYIDTPLGERPAIQGPACPGATDLWSCVEDFARWDAHLNSPGPLHRRARRAMLASFPMDEGGHLRYGGGLRFFELDGHRQLGHAGSDPGFRTQYLHDLKSGLAIVCFSNRESLVAWDFAFEAMRTLLRGGPAKSPRRKSSKPELPLPSPRRPAGPRVPEARDYLGYYHSPETGLQRALVLQNGRLRVQYPFGPGSWLKGQGPDEVLAENGTRLLFERGRDGRVRALVVDAPMSRACRRLRLEKAPKGRRLFQFRDRALMDRTFHEFDVNDLLKGI